LLANDRYQHRPNSVDFVGSDRFFANFRANPPQELLLICSSRWNLLGIFGKENDIKALSWILDAQAIAFIDICRDSRSDRW
jgi:hypothetical protein